MLYYIPADIPKMPKIDDSMLNPIDYGAWEMRKLTKSAKEDKDKYKPQELREEFVKGNREFMEWIENLPYTDFINVKIHRQDKSDVPIHIDLLWPGRDYEHYNHLYWNEPCGYRVVMSGQAKQKTYVIGPNMERHYVDMPSDWETNTYIMNYSTCIHGVDEDPGRDILFFQFNIDEKKHEKIVRRSIKKYQKYALCFDMDSKYG